MRAPKKRLLGVMLDPEEKGALAEAARAERRTMSGLAAIIIADWLRERGWLPAQDGAA